MRGPLPSNDRGNTHTQTASWCHKPTLFFSLFSLILQGPHWKRRVQQFFYCCLFIGYRGKFSTQPFPSNDTGIFTESSRCLATIRGYTYRHRLMRGIISLGRWDGLRCRDKSTKFHKDWFGRSRVNVGDTQTDTCTHTRTATWSHKPTLIFQNRKVGYKGRNNTRYVTKMVQLNKSRQTGS
jgi:hypothetical protein